MLKNILNSHYVLWCVLAIPAAMALYGYWDETLTYGGVIHASGEWAARLLIVTMAVTPLRLLFSRARWPLWLLQRRRDFGVATFAYALLHAVVYLQRKAELALILEEGAEPDLLAGWIAFALFVVLAFTSNDTSVRLLKRAWKKLHRLVYPAAILTFLHWALAAFDMAPALIYASILGVLEINA
jgi:sulfoxide reductase heme-binding subunit YedZ